MNRCQHLVALAGRLLAVLGPARVRTGLPTILAGLLLLSSAAAAGSPPGTSSRAGWSYALSAAYDVYVHTYPLATEDTTETIDEVNLALHLAGASARRTNHRWRLRTDLLFGSELFRQRFDGSYQWRPLGGTDRIRLDATWLGRQYRSTSDYSLSSDNTEGRAEARVVPLAGAAVAWDLRGGIGYVDYQTPSTLEQSRYDRFVGTFLRSVPLVDSMWRVGVRGLRRVYPDTTEINRDVVSLEADYESGGLYGEGVRAFHRSERRVVADDTVRPSAWSHWTDLRFALVAGSGQVILEAENELWLYDYETSAYFDSWRLGGRLGYRWGDLLVAAWHLGVAGENFAAGVNPETYHQVGIWTGLESYGHAVSGSIFVEYGRRYYRDPAVAVGIDGAPVPDYEQLIAYSDFGYWELWIMGAWRIVGPVSCEIMASYKPENHAEKSDDAAIGFASVRLVWRP